MCVKGTTQKEGVIRFAHICASRRKATFFPHEMQNASEVSTQQPSAFLNPGMFLEQRDVHLSPMTNATCSKRAPSACKSSTLCIGNEHNAQMHKAMNRTDKAKYERGAQVLAQRFPKYDKTDSGALVHEENGYEKGSKKVDAQNMSFKERVVQLINSLVKLKARSVLKYASIRTATSRRVSKD